MHYYFSCANSKVTGETEHQRCTNSRTQELINLKICPLLWVVHWPLKINARVIIMIWYWVGCWKCVYCLQGNPYCSRSWASKMTREYVLFTVSSPASTSRQVKISCESSVLVPLRTLMYRFKCSYVHCFAHMAIAQSRRAESADSSNLYPNLQSLTTCSGRS